MRKLVLLIVGITILFVLGCSLDEDLPYNLYINEFMASNETTLADEKGDYDDWIEIYNAGHKAVDVGGMYITDDLDSLMICQIPDTYPDSTTILPGGFLILWADKEPEQGVLHLADVKLSGDGEQIGLTDVDGVTVLDSLSFGEQTADISYGRIPDGEDYWQYFGTGYDLMPTPGETNGSGSSVEVTIVINEFMSHNDSAWPGPENEYPDWIELYNGSSVAVDVGGMYLSDDPDDPTLSMIGDDDPDATTIPAGSYLVLIADGNPDYGTLHLDFKLSDNEDFILTDKDGFTLLDQANSDVVPDDQSMGRVPDGSDNWEILNPSTPGGPNQ